MTRLIDADDLKETIAKFHKKENDRLHNPFWGSIGLNALNRLIDYAPTVCNDNYAMGYQDGVKKVLSERPHGKWIKKCERAGSYVGDRAVYSYTCPFCGEMEHAIYPFCHCGADMRGEDDSIGIMDERGQTIMLQSVCKSCKKYDDCSDSTKISPNFYLLKCRKHEEADNG